MEATLRVNLLPSEVVTARSLMAIKRFWGGAFGVGASLLIFSTTVAWTGPDSDDPSAGIGDTRLQIGQIEGELPALQAKLNEALRRERLLSKVHDRPDWGVLLAYFAQSLGDRASLDSCVLSWDPDGRLTLEIAGRGEEPGSEGPLVEGLERSGLFSSTTLLGVRRSKSGPHETVEFRVRSVFHGQPGGGATP